MAKAQINLTMKTRLSWWVMPLISCAVVWYWFTGRNEIDSDFIDWLVRYGFTIEVE